MSADILIGLTIREWSYKFFLHKVSFCQYNKHLINVTVWTKIFTIVEVKNHTVECFAINSNY